MKDIKTRNVIKGTIKSLDKAAIAGERMKSVYTKTKERAESTYTADEGSPSEYVAGRIARNSEFLAREGGYRLNQIGRKNFKEVKSNFIKAKENIAAGVKTKNTAGVTVKGRKLKKGAFVKGYNHQSLKGSAALKQNLAKRKAQQLIHARRNARTGIQTAKAAAKTMTHSVRAIVASARALISVIIAGGWIAVIVIIICCLFGAAFYFFGDESSDNYLPVSQEVESYSPVISKYAKQYGIAEYTELIKAVMMQESGGKGTDPMQSSECSYNKKYPNKPGSIKDPEYSIDCGVHYLSTVMKEAKVGSPVDIECISLALQGYNFGNGYISWAVSKYGGYTKANAIEFSKKQGGSSYGDPDYVDHVLRYYPYGNYSYDVVFNGKGKLGLPIKNMTQKDITSHFGPRESPGGFGSTNHKGLDIGFPLGTHVLACESGTVTTAGWSGGFGKCIVIDHGKSMQTYYAHLSKINVAKGQKVVRGQFIGEVGSTGNSTGPHLHLGVMIKGNFVNPEKGWLSIPK